MKDIEMSIYITLKFAPKHIDDDSARAMAKHIAGKPNIVEAIAEGGPLDESA